LVETPPTQTHVLIAYNLLMLAVDAAAIFAAARAKTVGGRLAAVGAAAFAAVLLCGAARPGIFGQMRLMACGLFVHGVILSAAMAVIAGHKRWIAAAAWGATGMALAVVGVDAFFIEPYWLDVSRLTLRSAKIEQPLRIVALADFQTDTLGTFERDVLRRVVAEQPDIVLLVGDYIQVDAERWDATAEQFRRLWREAGIAPPSGVYAVKGNIDPPQWTELFRDSNVHLFTDTDSVEAAGVQITGLSQPDSLDPFLRMAPAERFHIVFGHHPDYALSDVPADLLLAGHTHGGQVRLPLIGPLLTLSNVPRSWAAGVTQRRGGDSTLVVSRGTGLERGNAPRLRFLCRPELVVIQLQPAK